MRSRQGISCIVYAITSFPFSILISPLHFPSFSLTFHPREIDQPPPQSQIAIPSTPPSAETVLQARLSAAQEGPVNRKK
ncbi:hypothetical protein PIB30_006253 [Stylosanthes scabra]|uniref:Uncharacterized protein n=1 Tax=Stylosanthes scabra TaxID=79078 RepID=A0ABU6Q486_9FABA|nr:hypothetical protein [Stylosanthes scabra]